MNRGLGEATDALRNDDLDGALNALVQGYEGLLNEDSPVCRMPVGWSAADQICSQIGSRIGGPHEEPGRGEWNDIDLYIATQLYAGGGHTAVIGDFVRYSTSERSELLLTTTVERDIYPEGKPGEEIIARTGIVHDAVHVCPHGERLAALEWTMQKVSEIRPRRVFLFHHPQDAVAVSAVQEAAAGAWFLVHHADRQPTSGLHIRGLELVDLSPFTAAFSRLVLEKRGQFVPLTLADTCTGERPAFSLRSGGHLVTASSGSAIKFGAQYPEVVARTIQTTGGRHMHIGHLKKAQREAVAAELSRYGCDPQAFEYIKWVPSLARALWELGVDLLIGSMPTGGARTKIEACCAATPILTFNPPGAPRFGVSHIQPESLPLWQTVDELVALIEAIDLAWLEHHSRRVRDYFVQNHHPDLLRKSLLGLDKGEAYLPAKQSECVIGDLCHPDELWSSLRGNWEWARAELPGLCPGESR